MALTTDGWVNLSDYFTKGTGQGEVSWDPTTRNATVNGIGSLGSLVNGANFRIDPTTNRGQVQYSMVPILQTLASTPKTPTVNDLSSWKSALSSNASNADTASIEAGMNARNNRFKTNVGLAQSALQYGLNNINQQKGDAARKAIIGTHNRNPWGGSAGLAAEAAYNTEKAYAPQMAELTDKTNQYVQGLTQELSDYLSQQEANIAKAQAEREATAANTAANLLLGLFQTGMAHRTDLAEMTDKFSETQRKWTETPSNIALNEANANNANASAAESQYKIKAGGFYDSNVNQNNAAAKLARANATAVPSEINLRNAQAQQAFNDTSNQVNQLKLNEAQREIANRTKMGQVIANHLNTAVVRNADEALQSLYAPQTLQQLNEMGIGDAESLNTMRNAIVQGWDQSAISDRDISDAQKLMQADPDNYPDIESAIMAIRSIKANGTKGVDPNSTKDMFYEPK